MAELCVLRWRQQQALSRPVRLLMYAWAVLWLRCLCWGAGETLNQKQVSSWATKANVSAMKTKS